VAGRYGVALDATLAIGDAWNDVPLIDAAAIGVAMGSGPPELLSAADAVVADVAHDGVAEALERFVLA
jgi:hydroxymethylpyrimidine pyrophosphatase-like HAD family hydrolase